jgi:hypothetical protein
MHWGPNAHLNHGEHATMFTPMKEEIGPLTLKTITPQQGVPPTKEHGT